MRRHWPAVATGILLGAAATVSPGTVFLLFWAVGTAAGLHRFCRREDRRFLVGLFLAGFLVRAVVSIALDLGSVAVEGELPARVGPVQEWRLGIRDETRAYLLMGDSDYYSQRAWAFAQHLEGNREKVVVFRLNQYGWNAYVDLMGMFYGVFGFSPVAVKGLNWHLGAWMGPLIFLTLRSCFHRQIARWSAVSVAFFPSLILWSASNLKDTSLIFLTLLSALLFVRFDQARGRARVVYLTLLAAVLVLHGLVREGLFLILIASLAGAWIVSRLRVSPRLFGIGLGAAGLGAWLVLGEALEIRVRAVLASLFLKHVGYAGSAGMAYPFLPPEFYTHNYTTVWVDSGGHSMAVAAGMLMALVHFFSEPVPGRWDKPIHLLGAPQMAAWYGVLLFAGIGSAVCLRQGARRVLFLLLPALSLSFVMALASGNVGTLFRVRDLVTPFILSLCCAGLWASLYGSKGLFAGSAEEPLTRDTLRGSLVARRFSKIWSRFRIGTTIRLNYAFGVCAGWLAGSFPKRVGILLTVAVAVNILGALFLHQPWSPWNTGFRIGVLALGLWALRTSSEWRSLKEQSYWARVAQRLPPVLSRCLTPD